MVEIHTKYDSDLTNYLLRRVRKVVVISNGLKDYYTKKTGRNDIHVEPSGVDLEQFKVQFSINGIKDALNVPKDKIVYAYIGKYQTMGEAKGVDEIVQAFSIVQKKHPQCHLLIAGLEKEEFSIVKLVADTVQLDSKNYTLSTLEQKRFAEYLVASDVLLMNYPNTEHYAYFMSPTKLFAYMAVGKPVVSSDLPSIREVPDITGFVYVEQNDSVISYAEAMEKAILHLDLYQKEAVKNMETVKRYSWANRSKRILMSSQ
jgi:glycosyltransferase involved in cell wall biosynthesis